MGPLYAAHGQCVLSLALFVVVMYIGVFAKGSKVHQWLGPVRQRVVHYRMHFGLRAYGGVFGLLRPRLGGTLG